MKMELKSYDKFAKYQERLEAQRDKLTEQLSEKEREIADLQQEYISLFAEGEDTSKVMAQLDKAKAAKAALQDQLELVAAGDLRHKQLAGEVAEQYEELRREFDRERVRMTEEAKQIHEEAQQKIKDINERYIAMAHQFNTEIARGQFANVIDSLEVIDSVKSMHYRTIEHGVFHPGHIYKM